MSSILFYRPEKPKWWTEMARPFGFLTSILLQISKKWRRPFEDIEIFRGKSLAVSNKTEMGRLFGILKIHSVALYQKLKYQKKLKGNPLELFEVFFEKKNGKDFWIDV